MSMSEDEMHDQAQPHLELPKKRWKVVRLNCPLAAFDSARRLPEIRERSAAVRSPPGPVPQARSSSTRRFDGFPWSRSKIESSPETLVSWRQKKKSSLTRQRTIVFDAIVDVEIAKVKCIFPVVSAEHVCCEVRDEKAETWGEVVCLADFRV